MGIHWLTDDAATLIAMGALVFCCGVMCAMILIHIIESFKEHGK